MTQRRTLARFGPSRGGVRVLDDPKMGYVMVQWYEQGVRKVRAWPRTVEGRAEAKAWAQGFSERRHEARGETGA